MQSGGGRDVAGAIDTHVHLNQPRLLRKLDGVLERAEAAGVVEMIVVGYDRPSSEAAVRLAAEHPNLWAAVGVHPHDARTLDEGAWAELRELARRPRVVAIGETGLDFYRDLSPREGQREAFRRHLELAAEMGLAAICHCREAEEAVLEVLTAWPRVTRVWHCFDGTPAMARAAVEAGVWLGFGGTITYPESEWRYEAVREAPLERMLLETDAPYLAPYPKEGARPRDNEPAYVAAVAERVAELKGLPVEAVVAATAENARRAFGLRER